MKRYSHFCIRYLPLVITFDNLYKSTAPGEFINYSLPYPKWQFLSYLCEAHDLVLHGSQNPDIQVVEPRQAKDTKTFSNQRAIYATTDGIWVQYFAILDRKNYPELTLFNSCMQARLSVDQWSEPSYFFSITYSVLLQKPWCPGAIYILPRQTFIQEPAQSVGGTEIVFPHWISTQAAQPAAKLLVEPQDFPFLDRVHGHNDQKLAQLSRENPDGFPWAAALES